MTTSAAEGKKPAFIVTSSSVGDANCCGGGASVEDERTFSSCRSSGSATHAERARDVEYPEPGQD